MNRPAVSFKEIQDFHLWDKIKARRYPISFDLEITARCNNNCKHCYINLPEDDLEAKAKELSLQEINRITDEAASMGTLCCLITGGEPLLREDFKDIYLYLKKKGFLVSVFTNATLITDEEVKLFKKYPPRNIEITVYGVNEETYEKVTRRPGSFNTFTQGLNHLLKNGIKIRFKTMALRSNITELPEIAKFCRERTKDYFRFDPFLHLRFNGGPMRNEEIKSERLSPKEIVELERSDPERFQSLEKSCDKLIVPEFSQHSCDHLFHCGAGNGSFTVSYDGFFRLCPSLRHPDCLYDLRKGSLTDAWDTFVLQVRELRSNKKEFLENCRVCPIINLCLWCPAHAHLETGKMDEPVKYFCDLAHARAEALEKSGLPRQFAGK